MIRTEIDFLSVVIPFFNEEENIRPVLEEVKEVFEKEKIKFEILAVDDGSTDGTWARLVSVKEKMPELRLVKLKTNYGQTLALSAGIDAAQGDWILTMDGDGQNDPHSFPRLLQKAREGYPVISGWRKNRKDAALTRNLPSKIANQLLAAVTGLALHDSGCALKLYRADVLRSVSLYSDRHRFLPFLIFMRGIRVAEVVVEHRPRAHGKSKYGLSRVAKVFLDLLALSLFARFRESPRFYFFLAALPFLAAAAASFAFQQNFSTAPDPAGVIFFGAAFILGTGALSLASYGLLAEWMTFVERGSGRGH